MKRTIKKIMTVLWGEDIQKVKTDNAFVVSFDIFDTLVVRKGGTPESVFAEVEKRIFNNGTRNNFYNERIKARKRAKKMQGEPTIDDIYSLVEGIDNKECDKYKQIELSVECEMCIPNGKAVEKYNELKEKGKKIILCSDMYLPIDTMKKILDKCGINGYDNLFVSSDIGKSKKSGELFDYILKKYEIPSDKLIHIGDNPYIDYCVPRLKGINAFLIS